MESYKINCLNFIYPEKELPGFSKGGESALADISFDIKKGEFLLVMGESGSGKTTLLRQLKPSLAPHGNLSGQILFEGRDINRLTHEEESRRIGFVFQNPDNQAVTDKVWHELAFGLESLALENQNIRRRVAEIAAFFGIEDWFYKEVNQLSGGQKQILNLASVMAMEPDVLILDEPTAQLDPIAASDFLGQVKKINQELGVTVIMTEQRLEEVIPVCNRLMVLERGKIITLGSPKDVALILKKDQLNLFLGMPVPMKTHGFVENNLEMPLTVGQGRKWLDDMVGPDNLTGSATLDQPGQKAQENQDTQKAQGNQDIQKAQENQDIQKAQENQDIQKAQENQDIHKARTIGLKDLDLALDLEDVWFKYEKDSPDVLKGLSLRVEKGDFLTIMGGNGTGKTTCLSLIAGINKNYRGSVDIKGKVAMLAQNPQNLFLKDKVRDDLKDMSEANEEKISEIAKICRIEELLDRHPYDLSGGEQQRAALAKVLLTEPDILLLDEPTKGLDTGLKRLLAEIIKELREKGTTVIMVSHDIEFSGEYAEDCLMLFDGQIVSQGQRREFFAGNNFYTTQANRMARHLFPQAVTTEDIVMALGSKMPKIPKMPESSDLSRLQGRSDFKRPLVDYGATQTNRDSKVSKQTVLAVIMLVMAIPLTIYVGIHFFGDRKYYFTSLLILLEAMVPFLLLFEGRKVQARELVIIAVLCALGVAGRAAFFMIPAFKPVVALVIIAGVALGAETGFLIGAVTMLISNLIFGQGPWTPWQMFAMGLIGFLAGVIFHKKAAKVSPAILAVFGALATFLIYGILLNISSLLVFYNDPSLPMMVTVYLLGLPFDIVHTIATITFILLIGRPMLKKLDRIKIKYGLIN